MKNYTDKLGSFLEDYIHTHSISHVREDPNTFVSRLSTIFSPFFFQSEENILLEGLKAKALYCLWNIVIDDVIEYTDKGKDSILDSMDALTDSARKENSKRNTEAGQIIHDLMRHFHDLPSGPNKGISEELVFLDLTRILNGFDYERIIHENEMNGTMSEYLEFGVVTADVRIFLDMDLAICPYELNLSTIENLREAYRWFDLAVKLSSDIATFEREFLTEASQNAVIIYGQEKGLLPRDVFKVELGPKKQLLEKVIPPLMKEIENRGREYLSRSLECLKKIDEIDTKTMVTAFKITFEQYPGKSNFSPPPIK